MCRMAGIIVCGRPWVLRGEIGVRREGVTGEGRCG